MRKGSIGLKKGFSLVEVMIAVAVISIVFTIAMTAIVATGKSRKEAFQSKYCVPEISNFLKCYQMGGSAEFENEVLENLGIQLVGTQKQNGGGVSYTEYVIYYNSKFVRLTAEQAANEENRSYELIIMLYADGMTAQITQLSNQDTIFQIDKYQSRFDIGGGA